MPMMFNSQETQQESQSQERRYDPDTLRKVTALATRLQHDHHETLTAEQMATIGAEVGLKPEFVHQALAQLETEHARQEQERRQQEESALQAEQHAEQQRKMQQQAVTHKTLRQTEASATRSEFYSVCAALAAPLLFGLMAYHFKSAHAYSAGTDSFVLAPRVGAIQFFTLVAPVPIALLQGFAAGRKRIGLAAAAALIFALAPTVPFLAAASPEQYQQILTNILEHLPEMLAYAMLALPIVGAFGILGAWMRQQYFPFRGGKAGEDARQVQHKQYAAPPVYQSPQFAPAQAQAGVGMQAHTGYMPATQAPYGYAHTPHTNAAMTSTANATNATGMHTQRRAFLSVDVADVENLRQSATLVAVDYSFGQLRAWIEEVTRSQGGEILTGNGSGVRASFPTDGQAMRAARLMQERLPEFNQSLNRLPTPFRLRCGVSAGEMHNAAALERSQALLRAAEAGDTLVSGEAAAAALAELGPLAPMPGALMGDTAFVWRTEKDHA